MFQFEILVIMKVWMNRMSSTSKRQEAEKEGGLCRRPPFFILFLPAKNQIFNNVLGANFKKVPIV